MTIHQHELTPPQHLRQNRICCVIAMMIFGFAALVPGIALVVISQQDDSDDPYRVRHNEGLIVPGVIFLVIGTIFVLIGIYCIMMMCAGKEDAIPCFRTGEHGTVPVAAPNANAYNFDASAGAAAYNNSTHPFTNANGMHPHANLYANNTSPVPAGHYGYPHVAYGVVVTQNQTNAHPQSPQQHNNYPQHPNHDAPPFYQVENNGGPIRYTK